jgi:hypothetical protein
MHKDLHRIREQLNGLVRAQHKGDLMTVGEESNFVLQVK